MKNKIYINVAVNGDVNNILRKLLERIDTSALYDYVDEINLIVNGDRNLLKVNERPKYNFFYENDDSKKCEFPTLNKLWDDSKQSQFNVLYLHSKGAFRNNKNVQDWTEYLTYFNIERWKCIIEYLKKYDVVGVNLRKNSPLMNQQLLKVGIPSKELGLCHFSGNFWWAKSDYIKKLPKPDSLFNGDYSNIRKMRKVYRYMAEAWIGIGKHEENLKEVFNSNCEHYWKEFHRSEYMNVEWNKI